MASGGKVTTVLVVLHKLHVLELLEDGTDDLTRGKTNVSGLGSTVDGATVDTTESANTSVAANVKFASNRG